MKNKGFTLIELLGVVVVLALIMTLALPKIINSIKSSSKNADELTEKLIFNASKEYVESSDYFLKISGNKYKILLSELVNQGLLKAPIRLYGEEDVTDSKCVQVTYNTEYSYEIKDTCEEKKNPCILISGNPKTFGSKYKCYVNDSTAYNFYVLSNNEDNTTNLIMERNICTDGALATANNPCLERAGSAWNSVSTATSSWTNTKYDYQFEYLTDMIDLNSGEPIVEHFSSENARAVSETELSSASVDKHNQFLYEFLAPESEYESYPILWSPRTWDESTKGPKPVNNISGIPCYWLIENKPTAGVYSTYFMGANGRLAYNMEEEAGKCGIRPVITVNLN